MTTRTTFPFPTESAAIEAEQEERQIALEYLAEAWNSADTDGVDTEALAHAALFAAVATLVREYGEEAVAKLIGNIPDRISNGEYTLDRVLQ
ncbi:hypothetical protein [Pelagibacterium halotolerans]|jgi:predicted YcjX-like family ATPase|uniref:Uncharacterized protein n=1 Tax=Pelagibacterium halotolerans (strain DSM 22347 / JCM 15775 / CGMCC 1.7692 / B2) TaxID=1082931 RepID=G4RBV2_PELHB|nr:hypothetical protein [Pelagibacterium halotolerans]AEQ50615.1 hypothetical protein KKY_574 [Pelagibacterium halotolerans B2]QJR19445.1 hypothetical protein HKM20_13955 [Pelagibacterium halotolerans]SDZ91124.1 hypothetical protein SAMN05428936_101503 [Pelagibacterium halotolerans]